MLPRSGRQEDAGGRGCDQRGHADNRRDPPETGPEAHPEPALLADGLAHGGQLRRGGRAGGRALTLGPHRRRQLFEDGLIFWRHPGVGRHRSTSGRYPSWVGPKCPIRPARWNGRGRSSQRAEIKSERTSPPTVSGAERNPPGGFVKVISSARPPPRPLRPSGGQASTASGPDGAFLLPVAVSTTASTVEMAACYRLGTRVLFSLRRVFLWRGSLHCPRTQGGPDLPSGMASASR